MRRWVIAGCVIAVTGCSQAGAAFVGPPAVPITEVIDQLKTELAVFAQDTEQQAASGKLKVGCGGQTGNLSMRISNIEVDLSTAIDTSANGNISGSVPVSAITLGPSLSGSTTQHNSELVTLNFTPAGLVGPTKPGSGLMNLANALKALRDQLVRVSPNGQCLNFAKGKDSTIKLAFSAVRDVSGGVKFNILVLSLGAAAENKKTNENTITVSLDFQGSPPLAPPVPPMLTPPARGRDRNR